MRIERFPLQDRLALLDTGRCAHPEYAAAIIHRFADMTLPEYFQGFEAELERLRSTPGPLPGAGTVHDLQTACQGPG